MNSIQIFQSNKITSMLDSDVPLIEVPIRFRDCTVLNKMAALQHVSLNCNDLDLKFSLSISLQPCGEI